MPAPGARAGKNARPTRTKPRHNLLAVTACRSAPDSQPVPVTVARHLPERPPAMSESLGPHLRDVIEVLELYAIHLRAVIEQLRRPAADPNRGSPLGRYYEPGGEGN
jgi:hypothetical protein